MTFPYITNISDVLPYVGDGSQFGVFDREDGTTVIKYNYVDANTFTEGTALERAFRREFRGITFLTKTGEILSRPYHKFFNLNENQYSLAGDQNLTNAYVYEKLDGSMIHTFLVNNEIFYATKAGTTDTSLRVKEWVENHPNRLNFEAFVRDSHKSKITPIFEWLDHRIPIVVDYEKSNLVLTAMRDLRSGHYYSYGLLENFGKVYGIDVVKTYDLDNLDEIVRTAKELEGGEGFVIRKGDGDMIKIKSEWYVFLHKNREGILKERHVLQAILDETIDDILPFVTESDRLAVDKYRTEIIAEIESVSNDIAKRLDTVLTRYYDPIENTYNRKQMALDNALEPFGKFSIIGFRALPNYYVFSEVNKQLKSLLTQACNKDISLSSLKSELGITASYEVF